MTIAERHQLILDQLKEKGFVKVSDLALNLDVSLVTIRKDLKTLQERGLLFRSHGSASLHEPTILERHVDVKETLFVEEKNRIGLAARPFLEPNHAIIIGSGTTCLAFARSLPKDIPLTVLTGAMNVSLALMNQENIELIQLGGMVRKKATSVVGPFAEEMLAYFSCQTLFLGVDGIHPESGCTTSNLMEAHLNQLMIKTVQRTIVLCDHSKFGLRGLGKICDLDEVDTFITDHQAPQHMISELEEKGLDFIIV